MQPGRFYARARRLAREYDLYMEMRGILRRTLISSCALFSGCVLLAQDSNPTTATEPAPAQPFRFTVPFQPNRSTGQFTPLRVPLPKPESPQLSLVLPRTPGPSTNPGTNRPGTICSVPLLVAKPPAGVEFKMQIVEPKGTIAPMPVTQGLAPPCAPSAAP